MKFSIIGTGNIANKMMDAVSKLDCAEPYAVVSRSPANAESFKNKWQFTVAYTSYEDFYADNQEMLVYIAVPHSYHYEYAKACLLNGKHVLVEKPFTVNAKQAAEIIDLAKEKNLLIAEAMWVSYMPSRFMIQKIIDSGRIGKVQQISANLGYYLAGKERLEEPSLAGGAFLDMGIYPVNFALLYNHSDVIDVQAVATMSPKGIDWNNSVLLSFADGCTATAQSSMLCTMNRAGLICGDKGYLEVSNINNCTEIRIYDLNRNLVETMPVPAQINGYEYEVLSCINAIQSKKIECSERTHKDIIRSMTTLDAIRLKMGLIYPFEA